MEEKQRAVRAMGRVEREHILDGRLREEPDWCYNRAASKTDESQERIDRSVRRAGRRECSERAMVHVKAVQSETDSDTGKEEERGTTGRVEDMLEGKIQDRDQKWERERCRNRAGRRAARNASRSHGGSMTRAG